MNEPVDHLFPPKTDEKKETKTVSIPMAMDQEYVDQEKLVRPGEEAQEEEVSYHIFPVFWTHGCLMSWNFSLFVSNLVFFRIHGLYTEYSPRTFDDIFWRNMSLFKHIV